VEFEAKAVSGVDNHFGGKRIGVVEKGPERQAGKGARMNAGAGFSSEGAKKLGMAVSIGREYGEARVRFPGENKD